MKLGYSNPVITYEEIVNALKAIIDCSLNDNYLDDFNYLNVKYESEVKTDLDEKWEVALRKAIKDLEKAIDSSSKVIKNNLEKELQRIENDVLKMNSLYLIGQEKRKLASQEVFVQKLREKSLKTDVLYEIPKEDSFSNIDNIDTNKIFSDFERNAIINFPDFFKEEIAIAKGEEEKDDVSLNDLYNTIELEPIPIEDYAKPEELKPDGDVDLYRVSLIRKAIDKAKEKNDPKLVQMLEERLNKELGNNK